MSIKQNQLRFLNAHGHLEYAGYQWGATIESRDDLLANIFAGSGYCLLVTGPMFLWFIKSTGPYIVNFWYWFFLLGAPLNLLVMALCLVPVALGWLTQTTAVLFGTDDRIYYPIWPRIKRTGDIEQWAYLPPRVSQIASIERTVIRNNAGGHFKYGGDDGYFAYDVHIHLVSGERMCVGQYLPEDTANIVVAQLNIAKDLVLLSRATYAA